MAAEKSNFVAYFGLKKMSVFWLPEDGISIEANDEYKYSGCQNGSSKEPPD
jgi:hypothetical protein